MHSLKGLSTRKGVCVLFLLLIATPLASGCAGATFEPATVVLPEVKAYSPEVQARAADELETLGPPCPRDVVIAECSALHRFTLDYLEIRDEARNAD